MAAVPELRGRLNQSVDDVIQELENIIEELRTNPDPRILVGFWSENPERSLQWSFHSFAFPHAQFHEARTVLNTYLRQTLAQQQPEVSELPVADLVQENITERPTVIDTMITKAFDASNDDGVE